jgi:hypothetical protein
VNTLFNNLSEIIASYNNYINRIESEARRSEDGRAYGGKIRSSKGALVEEIAQSLVNIAWIQISGQSDRIDTTGHKISYNSRFGDTYSFKPDVLVKIDSKPIMAIECKAYAEIAMFKRILVDALIVKNACNNADYVLLQLESQLGGDFSTLTPNPIGSSSTRALCEFFGISVKVITLLEGERKVDRPIHLRKYQKNLNLAGLNNALNMFKETLKVYV